MVEKFKPSFEITFHKIKIKEAAMNHNEMLIALNSVHRNYILSLASVPMFKNEDSNKILENFYISIGNRNFDCTRILLDLSNDVTHEIIINEFVKSIHRTLICESFELVKQHASDTDQYENGINIKENDVFMYAALIRNAFSHNFKIEPIGYIKTKLKNGYVIKWRKKDITKGNIGNVLSGADLQYSEIFQLFLDIYELADKKLI